MSHLPAKKELAVIGDELFVTGFRLAGVSHTYVVDLTKTEVLLREELRDFLSKAFEDSDVGVVIIQDELRRFAEAFQQTSERPLIVYLPSGRKVGEMNVREYYASLVRSYLGISLEV
ncbi:MAG: V-type ATP synthase subunit F [Desulfurococcales archaeon]|nr:V-type ATP synthase subunit F [Desulfurococcales archaeon]